MTVNLTPEQARAMGIDAPKVKRKRTTKRTAPSEGYLTECVLDRERFTSMAAEDRHLAATGHSRYALVLVFTDEG